MNDDEKFKELAEAQWESVMADRDQAEQEEKLLVSLGMRTFGGSFVQSLGEALAHADYENTQRIKSAFPEYWKQYLSMGKNVKEAKPYE